jgi:sulfite exporter TauE/SafE
MTVWPILVASLAGSPHCAAMCGFIAGAAGRSPGARLAYHGSRLAGYAALGALAGAAGGAVDLAGRMAGIAGIAARGAGVALVLFGAAQLAAMAGFRWRFLDRAGRLAPWLAARARSFPPALRAAALGAVTALFPCGWLFAFVAVAVGTGSALAGAQAMAVFWIGTVPAVLAASAFLTRVADPVRRRLPALSAATLIVFGILTATGRMAIHHASPMAHEHLGR